MHKLKLPIDNKLAIIYSFVWRHDAKLKSILGSFSVGFDHKRIKLMVYLLTNFNLTIVFNSMLFQLRSRRETPKSPKNTFTCTKQYTMLEYLTNTQTNIARALQRYYAYLDFKPYHTTV